MADTSDIIIDTLEKWGVEVVFGLPGDGINGVMEALRKRADRVRFVLVRHEEAAAFAACAYAKFTGRIGVCLATSGPGGIHLLNGLYDAKKDSTPLLAITGQTYSDLIGSRYHQEIDMLRLYADVAAYNVQVNGPEHARMVTDNACRIALAQRGVAHINIPIDIQVEKFKGKSSKDKVFGMTGHDAPSLAVRPPQQRVVEAAALLERCEKVAILAGSGARGAREELVQVAQRLQAPVIKALLGKDIMPDEHPYCLGGLGLLGTRPSEKAMEECDCLLMLGTDFPYADFLPEPGSVPAIQVDVDATRLGTRYPVDIPLVGDTRETLQALLPSLGKRPPSPWLDDLRGEMKEWWALLDDRGSRDDLPMKPQVVAKALDGLLADDAIVTCDSGTITAWAARYLRMRGEQRFSLSGSLASMAPGLPYAIGAQVAYPRRQVVAFIGDGGLLMLGSELSSAAQHGLPIKVIVIRNDSLGMIKWEQMAFLGNPSFGTEMSAIDYAAYAEALGVKGFTVSAPDEVSDTIASALAHDGPALVECVVDPNEPPMPAHIEVKKAAHMAEALVRGQPQRGRIALTLFRDKLSDTFRKRP